jgi:hypothetical protein
MKKAITKQLIEETISQVALERISSWILKAII